MKILILCLTFAAYLMPNTIMAMEAMESEFIKKIDNINNVEFQSLTLMILRDNNILVSKIDNGVLSPLPSLAILPGVSIDDAASFIIKNKIGLILEEQSQIDELKLYEIDINDKKIGIYVIKLKYIIDFNRENFFFCSCDAFELHTRTFVVGEYTNQVYNFILKNKIPEYYYYIGDYVKSTCHILPNAASCYNFYFELEWNYGITNISDEMRKYYKLDLNMNLEELLLDENSSKQIRHFLHDLYYGKGPFKVRMFGTKELMQSRANGPV